MSEQAPDVGRVPTRKRLPPSSRLRNVAPTPFNPEICEILFCTKKIVFRECRWPSVSGTCRKRLNERSRTLFHDADPHQSRPLTRAEGGCSRELAEGRQRLVDSLDLVVIQVQLLQALEGLHDLRVQNGEVVLPQA